jgi:hypothetical protein
MDSIIAERLKKSNSSFLEYFNIWKSRLKPGKRHWIAAAVFLTVSFLISISVGLLGASSLSLDVYYLFIDVTTVVSIVFSVLFYFFYFKYLKVKRLSDFLPAANAISVLYFVLILIVYAFAHPALGYIKGGVPGKLLMTIFGVVPETPLMAIFGVGVFYLTLIFQGMGAMAIFLKKFEKSFFAKCLLLALLSFLVMPFMQSWLFNIGGFFSGLGTPLLPYQFFSLDFLTNFPGQLFFSLTHLFGWAILLMLFFLFCFIFHFGKDKWKKPFLLVLVFLFAEPILGHLVQILFESDMFKITTATALFWGGLVLPVSFAIVFLLYLMFLKFRPEPEKQKAEK